MDEAAVRASVAEFERNLQLKVRRPLSQWVHALEGVRVGALLSTPGLCLI